MFKRLILVLTLVVLLSTPVFAYENSKVLQTVISADSASIINIPRTGIVRTKSISMRHNRTSEDIGVLLKAESTGTIGLKVEVEQGTAKPTTEGSVDEDYVTTDTISFSGNESVSDNLWKIATLDTVVMPYIRFKVTGTGSNDVKTEIQMKVIK